MTLDEAITHCEEVAEENDDFKTATSGCKYWHEGFDDFKGGWIDTCRHPDNIPEGCSWGECDANACPIFGDCLECAKDHRQLSEWLRELKGYRKAIEEVKEYASIWTSYTVDMKPEEIAHNAVTDARDGFLAIIDRCLKEVKADADSD